MERQLDGLRIAELAAQTGTTVRALRYYEDLGLIQPARNRANARIYGAEARQAVHDIVALRRWGVSTDEVAKRYSMAACRQERQKALRELLSRRLSDLDRQRDELVTLIDRLQCPPGEMPYRG